MEIPETVNETVRAATVNKWNVIVQHFVDQYGDPYITVRMVREREEILATWLTRGAKSYRWWGGLVNNRITGVSRKEVMSRLEASVDVD